ncbi:hypothetical protein KDAU_64620 [Dictyobacter aurantiacus]|uniref:Uncharacterized protein n=1 Tax=Dictyobacter aurantiacus TaxID=1936993 RepID=A0A401ZQH6_9CHLR|nr:hypothetical protein KDAU_64620 [Dictyobacter aurantiacus]
MVDTIFSKELPCVRIEKEDDIGHRSQQLRAIRRPRKRAHMRKKLMLVEHCSVHIPHKQLAIIAA